MNVGLPFHLHFVEISFLCGYGGDVVVNYIGMSYRATEL